MHPLDDPKRYRRLDPKRVGASIQALGEQVEEAWAQMKDVTIPAGYKNISRICHNGMGGSALGGYIIRAVYDRELPVPFEVVNSYTLPGYVDASTLCVFLTYSGTTEEVLATRAQALKAKAKIFCITAGGQLGAWAKQRQIPEYRFDDTAGNPSAQPRMGLGYTLIGELGLFARLGLVRVPESEIQNITALLKRKNVAWGPEVPFAKNPAKQLAKKLEHKIVQLVASEHLAGNVHAWANQTNETAKTLSDHRVIPELNHHLLEGLKFPAENREHVHFLFFESKLYDQRNQFRYKVTKKVVTGNKLKHDSVTLQASTRLGQSFEMLAFGSYVTYYQGLLGNVDPARIAWVDLFKSELKKRKS